MELTAVEYVIQNVIKKHFGGGWLIDETIKKEIEQANEMFEKQIERAFMFGQYTVSIENGEQYYNETFKSE